MGVNGDPGPRPGSAAWWRARAERPRRASALTAERIVAAAIELLDAEGLDAFTMRRLAERLDTAHGSLYRHFESREAVLVAVHDHIVGVAMGFDPPGDTWAQQVTSLMRALRGLLKARPYLAEVWRTTEQLGPNALRERERGAALALAGGLEPETAARAYLGMVHFTVGLALVEQGLRFHTPELSRATRDHFRALPEDEFPAVRALAEHLAAPDLDAEFELGMNAMLAGIQALTVSEA